MYFLAGLSNLLFLDRKKTFEIGGHSLFPCKWPPKSVPLKWVWGFSSCDRLSSMYKTLSLIPDTTWTGCGGAASTLEVEAGESEVQSLPWLKRKSDIRLDYVRTPYTHTLYTHGVGGRQIVWYSIVFQRLLDRNWGCQNCSLTQV